MSKGENTFNTINIHTHIYLVPGKINLEWLKPNTLKYSSKIIVLQSKRKNIL